MHFKFSLARIGRRAEEQEPHCNQSQNLLEHLPWDGDLGHLEGDVGQRLVLDWLGRCERAQEVANFDRWCKE